MANNNETSVTFKAFNQDFNKAVKEMKNEISLARKEFQLQDEQLKATGNETDRLATKLNHLKNNQQIMADQVKATEQQLNKVKEVFGENSTEAQKMSQQLLNAKLAYERVSNQIRDTETALTSLQHQTSSSAQALQRLKQEEASLVQETKRMNAEFDLQKASLDSNASQADQMKLSLSQLTKQQQHVANQTQNIVKQLDAAKEQYGQNSSQVQQLETKLLQLQTTEKRLANEINSSQTALNNQEQAMRQLGTLLVATGNELDQFTNVLGSELSSAIQKGTASTKQLENAIQSIGKEALNAEVDFDKLRSAIVSLDSGASMSQIKSELQQLATEAKNAEESVNDLGGSFEQIAGAVAVGGGLAGAVQTALDMSSLDTKIEISMEVPESSKAAVKDAINVVNSYIGDQEAALEGVRRQWALNKQASDESNAAVVKMAGVVAKAFQDVDFTELIQETNEIGAALKVSNVEAISFVNALLDIGFPPEELDTISEYVTQMKEAGFSVKEIQAIFEKGVNFKPHHKVICD